MKIKFIKCIADVCDGNIHLLQFNINEINTGCRQPFHQPTHKMTSIRFLIRRINLPHKIYFISLQTVLLNDDSPKNRGSKFNLIEILCWENLNIYLNLCVIKVFKIQKLNILQTNLYCQKFMPTYVTQSDQHYSNTVAFWHSAFPSVNKPLQAIYNWIYLIYLRIQSRIEFIVKFCWVCIYLTNDSWNGIICVR